jgi:uncharacterized membrane protein YeiB
MVTKLYDAVGQMSAGVYVLSSIAAVATFLLYQEYAMHQIAEMHAVSTLVALFAACGMVAWWLEERRD